MLRWGCSVGMVSQNMYQEFEDNMMTVIISDTHAVVVWNVGVATSALRAVGDFYQWGVCGCLVCGLVHLLSLYSMNYCI